MTKLTTTSSHTSRGSRTAGGGTGNAARCSSVPTGDHLVDLVSNAHGIAQFNRLWPSRHSRGLGDGSRSALGSRPHRLSGSGVQQYPDGDVLCSEMDPSHVHVDISIITDRSTDMQELAIDPMETG